MEEESLQFDAFRHLNVELTHEYRLILRAFNDARERFALHLKPADVFQFTAPFRHTVNIEDEGILIQHLQNLVKWGNLNAHADNSEVRTVEDFNKPRFLYQLSREGEAVERALDFYRENIEQPGELQATALLDILNEANGLQVLLQTEGEEEKKYRAFRELFSRFEELTSRAQQFIGSIQRVIDLQGADVNTFLKYKATLLDYLERFIRELVVKGAQISAVLLAIPSNALEEALNMAAARDLIDALDKSAEAIERSRLQWQKRWRGLSLWFVGDGGPSQADQLRARARSAIPDLLTVISSLNERRAARSDRTADYRTLARWFANVPSVHEAHMLWRAAFCMTPVRHLATTPGTSLETLASPRVSWLDAEPLWISPRLRNTGHIRKPGRIPAIVDCSVEKQKILVLEDEETRQLQAAREKIATGQARRLSEFVNLDRSAFSLLLECVGAALPFLAPGESRIETTSRDGTLLVCLEKIMDKSQVRLSTSDGVLTGPDYLLTISDANRVSK